MPIPTQIVSNGEYMPARQTDKQQRVEARTLELAAGAAKKLGVSRRQFLAGTGGMAAALLAMNEVFGRFFDVKPIEMFESAAWAATGAPVSAETSAACRATLAAWRCGTARISAVLHLSAAVSSRTH